MSRITLFGAGIAVLIFVQGCTRVERQTVVAIRRTNTYHREFCAPVHMAKTKVMSLEDARRLGMRACTVCKPDQI